MMSNHSPTAGRYHPVRRGVFRQQPTVGKEKIPYRQSMADPDDASIYKDTETFSTFSIDNFAPGMGFTGLFCRQVHVEKHRIRT